MTNRPGRPMKPERGGPRNGFGGMLLALAVVVGIAMLLWLLGLWGAGPLA